MRARWNEPKWRSRSDISSSRSRTGNYGTNIEIAVYKHKAESEIAA